MALPAATDRILHDDGCPYLKGGACTCGGHQDMNLSNKGCRNAYLTKEEGRGCPCPEGRCWYDEQIDRRRKGLRIIEGPEWQSKLDREAARSRDPERLSTILSGDLGYLVTGSALDEPADFPTAFQKFVEEGE